MCGALIRLGWDNDGGKRGSNGVGGNDDVVDGTRLACVL